MIFTGIGDEAGTALQAQIDALRELGWTNLEARTVQIGSKGNLHDIPEPAFDEAARMLDKAGVSVYCFGSTIMNWSRRVGDPFELTIEEVQRAIPRMQRLGCRFVRIMSFKPDDEEYRIPPEVFKRVREVTNRFLDVDIQPLHENCMNYGGMSWQHALELLDKCPGLRWVFDTANPLCNPDRSKPRPWPKQDPWEFWVHLRDHTEHIHVKDAVWNNSRKDADYTWPGEGEGRVADILKDAIARGYEAGLSIEPHMVTVFHDPKHVRKSPLQSSGAEGRQGPAGSSGSGDPSGSDLEQAKRKNFIEYGRVLQELVSALSQR